MYYRELNFPPIPEILLSEDFIPEIGTDDIGYGVKHFKNALHKSLFLIYSDIFIENNYKK